MSAFGSPTPVAQALAGISQAQQVQSRDKERKRSAQPDSRKRPHDEVEIDVQTGQAADAVRSLKSGADEESTDDRRAHDQLPHTDRDAPATGARPRLDVQG